MSRNVFLAAPGYGNQTAASGRALWRASRDMSTVSVEHMSSSLLAANFNGLWCSALNRAAGGEPVDYFAMLHDDVGPDDFWLDELIDEMEANELDILGVAVPIKDSRGLTSLAIDDGDTWRPRQRLTVKELMSLPQTITSDDVGGPLLINTGCWVCRFDPEWAKKVHFEINDRIVFNRATGKYHAQCEPEDWFFSRLCHELNLRIGATRAVTVSHRGAVDFSNDRIWGQSHDSEYGQDSVVEHQFPFDVIGWLHPDEGLVLADLAKGRRVLEIGSYFGKSTICIAREAESVLCIDYFDGRGTVAPCDTLEGFRRNLSKYQVSHKVAVGTPGEQFDSEFDLVFIDGSHEAESVQRDIETAIAALKPGGLIAFHDYRTSEGEVDGGWDPGVTESVDKLIQAGGQLLSRHKTLAVVRPPVHASA